MSLPRERLVEVRATAVDLAVAQLRAASDEVKAEIIRRARLSRSDEVAFLIGALAALVATAHVAGRAGLDADAFAEVALEMS